jgi:hypothetical protein
VSVKLVDPAAERLCKTFLSPILKHRLSSAFVSPESHLQLLWVRCSERAMAMTPTKPRVWTEDEDQALIELAYRKASAPAIAKQLGRHIASVKRRARRLGLLLPAERRGSSSLAGVSHSSP